jgi:single-stranded DNA-binding protein
MSIHAAFFGTLGGDAELKVSKAGRQYLRFRVHTGTGEGAAWVGVMAFVDDAAELEQKLWKGASVYIEGSLRLDEWVAQDGTAKHGLSVIAWRVDLAAIGKNKPNKSSRTSKSASNDFHDDQIGF